MRILLWHGYLLGGTGSNVYTRALVHEWRRAGHEVVVFSQEPHPEAYDLGGAEAVRPDIGGLLPVFVVDRYEDLEARRLQELTPEERERYVAANAAGGGLGLPAGGGGARPAEPRERARAAPRRGERGAPGGLPRRRRADGRLL